MLTLLQIIFWLAAGTTIYTFLGYPFLIGLLARYFRRPVRKAPITPQVTLLIPAYNEEEVIAQKIKNSLALDYPQDLLDIVIVTDGSNDGTVGIVSRYADRGVRLYHQPQRHGKIAAVNRVMPSIQSDIVVFSDANTMLDTGTLKAIVRNFADPAVGGVAGEKQVSGHGEGLYWRYESYLKRCDSALSSVMGAAGELFSIRRELFQPPEEDSVIEDFIMSMRLVGAGWRIVYEPKAVAREDDSPSLAGDWQRRTRISAGGFQSIVRLPNLLNPIMVGWVAWQYLSHRVLRWAATPFLLPTIYILNLFLLTLPFYRLLLIGQTLFYGVAFSGYVLTRLGIQRRIPFTFFYFCFTNAAAVVGFWRYLTNSQPVTWAKVR